MTLMSASDDTRDSVFAAQYRDGIKAVAHDVTVAFIDNELQIRGQDINKLFALGQASISPRLGRLPRTLTLPDGCSVVIPDTELLAQYLGETRHHLHRMESRGGYAVLGITAIVATLALLYFIGIPMAADASAQWIGPALEKRMTTSTLEGVDAQGVWKPSVLDSARQDKIRADLQPTMQAAGVPADKLVFRSSSKEIGANAFALMDSNIVLTDTLVELLNATEINAVVAHELGHIHHHHNMRMLIRQIGMSGVLVFLTGMGDVGSTLAHSLGLANYSREFEAVADAYADQLLIITSQSPCNLATALQKLEQQSRMHPDGVTQWFASHPRSEARIDAIAQSCPSSATQK